jgi:hypothetical protein
LLPVDLVGGDVVEIVSSHKTVVIEVSLHENLLDFLVIEVFTKVLGDLLELVGGDLALK